jgi:hypothetical protein
MIPCSDITLAGQEMEANAHLNVIDYFGNLSTLLNINQDLDIALFIAYFTLNGEFDRHAFEEPL